MLQKELKIEQKNIKFVPNVNIKKSLDFKNFSKLLESIKTFKNQSTIGISVSSGVDSMCLLHLADIWAKKNKKNLLIISYNHNIRKETVNEVKYVKKISKKLGWQHTTLNWKNPAKKNILEKARIARYSAISEFCKKNNIDTLLVGHHLDDLIETFFMRIIKGSSMDGLCPMFFCRKIFNINLIRPLLKNSKNDIYQYAKQNNINFFEDPSNKNLKFTRTKIRNYLRENENLRFNLEKSVSLFCKLRNYFDKHILNFFSKNVFLKNEGYIIIEREEFIKLPEFLLFKIVNKVIMSVGNKKYPLRSRSLINIAKIIHFNFETTLSVGGCLVKNTKKNVLIIREYNQIKNLNFIISEGAHILWDNKFLISNLSRNIKFTVTPLGKELENKDFRKFYFSKKKIIKKLSFDLKKTLPVIKTLEGCAYIPHLNIYNSKKLKNIVNLCSIEYCKIKDYQNR